MVSLLPVCACVYTWWSSGKKSTSKADPRGKTSYYDGESYNSRQSEPRAAALPSVIWKSTQGSSKYRRSQGLYTVHPLVLRGNF